MHGKLLCFFDPSRWRTQLRAALFDPRYRTVLWAPGITAHNGKRSSGIRSFLGKWRANSHLLYRILVVIAIIKPWTSSCILLLNFFLLFSVDDVGTSVERKWEQLFNSKYTLFISGYAHNLYPPRLLKRNRFNIVLIRFWASRHSSSCSRASAQNFTRHDVHTARRNETTTALVLALSKEIGPADKSMSVGLVDGCTTVAAGTLTTTTDAKRQIKKESTMWFYGCCFHISIRRRFLWSAKRTDYTKWVPWSSLHLNCAPSPPTCTIL